LRAQFTGFVGAEFICIFWVLSAWYGWRTSSKIEDELDDVAVFAGHQVFYNLR